MSTYYYLVAVPDDSSDIEIKLFYDFLKQYKCKDVIIIRQGVLLSKEKHYIAITKSVRGLCISVIKNATVTLQEYLPVDIVCQDQLQTTVRFRRIIEMLQTDGVLPVFCYQAGTYKFGEEVSFSDIKYNSTAFMKW
ncbi:MAG: hypothetical protein LBM93_13980 [Oscillospiraceae bacterium]|nr:hypothetical protein [Oscillospiraceae bacterium]